MDELRSIIREEVRRMLFGQPIPEPGDKNFKPYLHDLETVLTRAIHFESTHNAFEDAFVDISVALDIDGWSPEEKIEEITKSVRSCEAEINQLKKEWRADNRALMQSFKSSGK